MTLEEKVSILKSISEIVPENAAAEDEDEKDMFSSFLPLRSYSKLADTKVFLITGGRGAGKSKLFHVLTSNGGLEHVLSESDRKRYTKLNKAVFLAGSQSYTGCKWRNFTASFSEMFYVCGNGIM